MWTAITSADLARKVVTDLREAGINAPWREPELLKKQTTKKIGALQKENEGRLLAQQGDVPSFDLLLL